MPLQSENRNLQSRTKGKIWLFMTGSPLLNLAVKGSEYVDVKTIVSHKNVQKKIKNSTLACLWVARYLVAVVSGGPYEGAEGGAGSRVT